MSSNSTPKGRLLIITAPSGAGKTTVVHYLLREFDQQLAFSVSATTRPARSGEVDGVDYYFMTPKEFEAAIEQDQFAEWEEVYAGRKYGTLKSEIERLWSMEKTIVFDLEVVGATRLKKMYPEESLAVFIQPPSPDILFERLRNRATEDEDSLKARIERASLELSYADTFDLVLVNDKLENTLNDARQIVLDFLSLS